MRLVQLTHHKLGRRIALVQEPQLLLIYDFSSIYSLAMAAIKRGGGLRTLVHEKVSNESLAYDTIYEGQSAWQLLPAFDHPHDLNACILSGTGLTHQASADNRQAMHDAETENTLTDSMKMYRWGVEKGKPQKDTIGIQPEWFYKGNGALLKAHGEALEVPPYADDGGEEPEIAGLYIIAPDGAPWRLGFATANEFSDHVMERKNYLYLAPSKLRQCALGPELTIRPDLVSVAGEVSVHTKGQQRWHKTIQTGEANMSHSLANLEYHHFKYSHHLLPGQVHIHFLGADAFSFGEQVTLEDGDIMNVHWTEMGRALMNPISISEESEQMLTIQKMH